MRQTSMLTPKGAGLLLILATAFMAFRVSAAATTAAESSKGDNESTTGDQCGLYLALSSTSTGDNTVWGIYAGKDYQIGETVGVPELSVNTLNLRYNVLNKQGVPPSSSISASLAFLEESFWVGEFAGAKYELDDGRSIAYIGGSGSLGASSTKLISANWNQQKPYQRKAMGERTGEPHPSRGAISPFYDNVLRTLDSVNAGTEIFVDYGNTFDDEKDEDDLLKDDYAKLDETVNQMIGFFEKHKAELDGDSKREIYNFIVKDVLTAAVGSTKAKKIASLLPREPEELHKVRALGGVMQYTAPLVFRSLDWLQEHGRCMDNLRSGASTITNAGRGAFATRAVKEGSVVVPVPLLQIPDKSVLDMYSLVPDGAGGFARQSDKVIGTQLLLNYCFGHPESTMVFVPTGSNVGLINHSDKPNAKLVWSSHPSHHRHWLQLEPSELVNSENNYLGLMLEVVALRDISEGEEVFIDYGREWKATWDVHEKNWNERINSGSLPTVWPTRALDMNEEYANKAFKTAEDAIASPYPENLDLAAFMMPSDDEAAGTMDDPRVWEAPPSGRAFTSENLVESVVVDSVSESNGSFVYTIHYEDDVDEVVYVKDVPHSAFTFVDAPETSDQFTPDPFRHYIGLPDEIFPEGPWRNAKASE